MMDWLPDQHVCPRARGNSSLRGPLCLQVVWHGPGVGLSILRCSTADTDRLRLTLATLTSIAGRQLAHNTLFVSGRLANVKRAAVAAASRSPICASQASLAAAVQEIQNVTA